MSKECLRCREVLSKSTRVDAKFCSAACRSAHHHRPEVCPRCNLGHSSVGWLGGTCAPCYLFDLIQVEKRIFSDVVAWITEKCICFYCGESSTDVEHVVPRRCELPTWTVPACHECNGIAGSKLFDGVLEKAEFIRERRRKKYRKLLKTPVWEEDELEELSTKLAHTVRMWTNAKKSIQAQLDWDPLAAQAKKND